PHLLGRVGLDLARAIAGEEREREDEGGCRGGTAEVHRVPLEIAAEDNSRRPRELSGALRRGPATTGARAPGGAQARPSRGRSPSSPKPSSIPKAARIDT